MQGEALGGRLTIEELVRRIGCRRSVLETVLRDEIAAGRVAVTDGRFAIVPGALPRDVAEALRGLEPPDVAVVANGGRRERPSGGVSASDLANLNFAVYGS
jgi:hypothetical protein